MKELFSTSPSKRFEQFKSIEYGLNMLFNCHNLNKLLHKDFNENNNITIKVHQNDFDESIYFKIEYYDTFYLETKSDVVVIDENVLINALELIDEKYQNRMVVSKYIKIIEYYLNNPKNIDGIRNNIEKYIFQIIEQRL